MITLDQIRALESRVEKAVALIASLRLENASMRTGLSAAETRVVELESLVADFQCEQEKIEEGIIEALRKLDSFEDTVHESLTPKVQTHSKPSQAPFVEPDKAVGAKTPRSVTDEGDGSNEHDAATLESGDSIKPGDSSDSLDIF